VVEKCKKDVEKICKADLVKKCKTEVATQCIPEIKEDCKQWQASSKLKLAYFSSALHASQFTPFF
jgi:hypothetical protein